MRHRSVGAHEQTLRTVRDISTIDCELRVPLAIPNMVREEEGRTPSMAVDRQLLDERAKL